jgi:Holliday junction resolvase-like predicted endonuclease
MTFEANQEFDLVTKFGNKLMTVFVKERVRMRRTHREYSALTVVARSKKQLALQGLLL